MYQTLIEENSGHGWAIVPSPNAGQYQSNALSGVACSAVGRCIAVGSTEGIACVSDTDCRGVGSGESTTLVEENTGHGWQIVPSPNAGNFDGGTLSGVTCAAVKLCVAVGSYDAGGIPQTLIEENTGSAWQIVPSPNPRCAHNTACDSRLEGVACPSATHCIAVGAMGFARTLIEENIGEGWEIVPNSNTMPGCRIPSGCQNASLDAVTCADSTHCLAVGLVIGSDPLGGFQSMIQTNTGSGWASVPSPGGALLAVSCATANDCMAVGDDTIVENRGVGWMVVASPALIPNAGCDEPLTCNQDLAGVTCPSRAPCIAVGAYGNAFRPKQTLIEQNAGSGWVIVSSPDVTRNGTPG
jgi:hypothetical protein